MGGRGGSFGGGSRDGALMGGAPREIDNTYFDYSGGRGRGYQSNRYRHEVLEATTDGKGNLTFGYAEPVSRDRGAKTNVRVNLTYKIQAGAVDGETFNINWDKVNSISGQTFGLRQAAKEHGLRFDGRTKTWRRPGT